MFNLEISLIMCQISVNLAHIINDLVMVLKLLAHCLQKIYYYYNPKNTDYSLIRIALL